nr:DUF411 domain-containing protein [uncultured Sphingomonas sp.]
MKKRLMLAIGLMLFTTAAHAANMTVVKSASCGCCSEWVKHVQAAGFSVKIINTDDIMTAKAKAGVPENLTSCHTALVNGYVVEGHVPAADIKKLLAAKPKAKGIAVAGMPMGSPGMEQGGRKQTYNTIIFRADGTQSVFARH